MVVVGCGMFWLSGCEPAEIESPSEVAGSGQKGALSGERGTLLEQVPFLERAAATGLDFVHFNGRSGELLLAEITCGGAALFDADGDGDLDAFFPQGQMLGPDKSLEDSLAPAPEPLTGRFFRNDLGEDGRLRWTEVTESLGLRADGYGCAIAVGDMDNDGRPDLYLANLGRNQLLRNLGGGAFEDVTSAAGVEDGRSGVVATFLDYDSDGWLDLFLGNNMAFDNSGRVVCRSLTGAKDYCGPGAFPSESDRLFRNRGDGSFEDATTASGLASAPAAPTLGAVAADLDGDGWTDLYVANDGQPNNLWINGRDGSFEDRALVSGSAVNGSGAAEASMGVDAGDFDGDGDLDLVLSHLVKETNTLYRNLGDGVFQDATTLSGLGAPSLPYTAFGTGWLDYDGDGWLDLVIANGAVTLIPALVQAGDPFPLHQPNQLFHSLGAHSQGASEGRVRFEDVTAKAGAAFQLSEVSRGLAMGDVDNDGDTDLVIINNGGPARLLVNQVGQNSRWLGVRLVAGDPTRDVPGARVRLLREGAPPLTRRVRLDGSYGSASDPRVLFGLGSTHDPKATALRVLWPGGLEEEFAVPSEGRYTELRKGSGRVREKRVQEGGSW